MRKPCESHYAQYRRFLISNSGVPKSYNYIRDLLASKLDHDNKKFLREHYLAINFIYQSEKNNFSNDDNEQIKKIPPNIYRNCPMCSEIGFHTDLFNMPWITYCPVHLKRLETCCHLCKKPWPSFSMVSRTSNCRGCGVDISFKRLIELGAFSDKRQFNVISFVNKLHQLDSLYPIKSATLIYQVDHHFLYRGINQLSVFQPTAVLANQPDSAQNLRKLEAHQIPIYEYKKLAFKLDETNYRKRQKLSICLEIKRNVIKSLLPRLLSSLNKIAMPKHGIGTCLSSASNNQSCLYCNTWRAWLFVTKYILNPSEASIPDTTLLSNWFPYDLYNIKDYRFSLAFPKLATKIRLQLLEKESQTITTILPKNIQSIIYYIDLCTTFIHLYQNFQYMHTHESAPDELSNWPDLPPMAKQYNELFCPLYITKTTSKHIYTLTFPAVLISPTLIFGLKHQWLAVRLKAEQ